MRNDQVRYELAISSQTCVQNSEIQNRDLTATADAWNLYRTEVCCRLSPQQKRRLVKLCMCSNCEYNMQPALSSFKDIKSWRTYSTSKFDLHLEWNEVGQSFSCKLQMTGWNGEGYEQDGEVTCAVHVEEALSTCYVHRAAYGFKWTFAWQQNEATHCKTTQHI